LEKKRIKTEYSASGQLLRNRPLREKKMKKNKKIDVAALIGRTGPEAAIALRNRKGGAMPAANTRRNRTRTAQRQNAIAAGW